ncbi:hypothetical protein K438DRAFT_1782718 [Mycena galopus ATCC 62051]|nr:hypothetical protein K438DRAFT_1782718 [Mycena galopus ATCC 62051]
MQGAMWSGTSDVPLGCYLCTVSLAREKKGGNVPSMLHEYFAHRRIYRRRTPHVVKETAWDVRHLDRACPPTFNPTRCPAAEARFRVAGILRLPGPPPLPAFSAPTPPSSVLRRQHKKRGAKNRDYSGTIGYTVEWADERRERGTKGRKISKQRRQPARRFVRCLETEVCVGDVECGTRCDFCGVGGRETDQGQQVEDDVTTRGEESEVREARRVLPSAAQVFLCSETALYLSARGPCCASGRSLAVIGVSYSLAITLDVVVDEEHSAIFDANIAKCAFLPPVTTPPTPDAHLILTASSQLHEDGNAPLRSIKQSRAQNTHLRRALGGSQRQRRMQSRRLRPHSSPRLRLPLELMDLLETARFRSTTGIVRVILSNVHDLNEIPPEAPAGLELGLGQEKHDKITGELDVSRAVHEHDADTTERS